MATNDMLFITTPTAFYASIAFTSIAIPDNTLASMLLLVFQVTLHNSVTMIAPVATMGPDNIPSDTLGHSYYWSHGYVPNLYHTSPPCRIKKTRHFDVTTGTTRINENGICIHQKGMNTMKG